MLRRAIALAAAAFVFALLPAASFALTPYSQDFEALTQADPGALAADGWLIFANVFSPDGSTYYYGYGVFPAPNTGQAFCAIATGQGGAEQGLQQLTVYSDYNNGDHALGNRIEANTFQEQTIQIGDVGQTWIFRFQAKLGNLEAASTALAFIKVLNPNAGYSLSRFETQDMTSIPTSWNDYSIAIEITPDLVGQILQIGYLCVASHYEGSAVIYDNIVWEQENVVSTTDSSWGEIKSRY